MGRGLQISLLGQLSILIHLFTNIRKANFTWIGKRITNLVIGTTVDTYPSFYKYQEGEFHLDWKEDYKSRYWDNCRYLSIFLEISGRRISTGLGRGLQISLLGQLSILIHLFRNIRKANFTWIGKRITNLVIGTTVDTYPSFYKYQEGEFHLDWEEDYKSRYWDNCRYLSIFLEISGRRISTGLGRGLQISLLGQLSILIHLFRNIRKANFTWIGKRITNLVIGTTVDTYPSFYKYQEGEFHLDWEEDYKSRYWDNCRYLSIFLQISGRGISPGLERGLQISLLGQLSILIHLFRNIRKANFIWFGKRITNLVIGTTVYIYVCFLN